MNEGYKFVWIIVGTTNNEAKRMLNRIGPFGYVNGDSIPEKAFWRHVAAENEKQALAKYTEDFREYHGGELPVIVNMRLTGSLNEVL